MALLFFFLWIVVGGLLHGATLAWITSRQATAFKILGVLIVLVLFCDYSYTVLTSFWDGNMSFGEKLGTAFMYCVWFGFALAGCIGGFQHSDRKFAEPT